MADRPAWQWNEFQQLGSDFSDPAEVERYERRMREFRDLAAEDAAILKLLDLPNGSRILEIGAGTGHFALAAARAGHCVTAADISPAMLRCAQARAESEGLTGMEFRHAGFLTLEVEPAAFDAAVSVAALHHLPDLWKAVALEKIRRALKPGGLFFLGDVVFAWTGQNHGACFDAFVNALPEGMRRDAIGHVAKEHSTLDWIMEGLLVRAGFQILRIGADKAPLVHYFCRAGKSG
jgi:putative AdoMet-dependent methyltransferase